MNKVCFYNLAMIITDICNLNCAHCMHGQKDNTDMSDEVIKSLFDQTKGIFGLSICGGEVTFALERLEKTITYLMERNIKLWDFFVTINGTNYSEELLRLIEEVDKYIGDDETHAFFGISLDRYHLDEMRKLGIKEEFKENVTRYKESKYLKGFRYIDQKLYREGNAENLDKKLTVPFRPMKYYMTYAGYNGEYDPINGDCHIGPLISVNQAGLITECDASNIHQRTLYNYGTVYESIEEQIKEKALVLKPKRYLKKCDKEIYHHLTYNR